MPRRKVVRPKSGYVYLIHLEPGLAHARHYLGWSCNIQERVRQHVAGTGSPLLRAATMAGITWWVAQVWDGSPRLERRLKDRHKGAATLCPVCSPAPREEVPGCFCPDPPLGFFAAHPPCDYHVSYAFDL